MAKTYLSADTLREHFTYDPETGYFTRRIDTERLKAGAIADRDTSYGYRSIGLWKQRYLSHRVAFLYMTGEIPLFVDHINGDRSDNRWTNLRAATRAINQQNMRRARKDSKSGFQGVQRANGDGSWRARIRLNGKQHNIGCYATPEKAHEAYLEAKRKLHQGCTI